MRKESTPDIKTVEQLCEFFDGMHAANMVKTVLYEAVTEEEAYFVAVLMRGDRAINEVKLVNHLGCIAVTLCNDDQVREITGAEPGFAGPLGLRGGVKLIADESVKDLTNFLCGCCETDYHCLDVNHGRDFPTPTFVDVRTAEPGDMCVLAPDKPLTVVRGIEIGHIFKLGTKYSEAMGCKVLGKDGKQHPVVMGCYGIGTTRIAQCAVEQGWDEKGIVWPWAMAPFHVVVTVAGKKDTEAKAAAETLYEELGEKGYEMLLDDRDAGLGSRLKDAELMGIPFRVLFGRGFKDGLVEIACRKSGETADVPLADVHSWIEERRA